ncbi:MAG: FAD-dependent thymidylate synthase [Candidatus Eremiobacteraeota bacterium]|nr:FAD-dependent thymidylate synthase [Candidatus Eremiobacteraeota bacterium]
MALKVVLLSHSPDPERAVATAARNCYSPRDVQTIDENWTRDDVKKMVARVRDAGHLSTFEHTMFTFGVSGVSRALTHQLVRHRHMSFEQKSQRYIKVKGQFEYVTPPSIGARPEIKAKYDALMRQIAEFYGEALAAGTPAEDARFSLPNAAETQIVITANARALLDFFTLRTCNNAQWEIRELAFAMLRLAKRAAPDLFIRAGATCVRGYCNEPNGPECPRYIVVSNPVKARRKAEISESGPRRANTEIVADQQTAATAG